MTSGARVETGALGSLCEPPVFGEEVAGALVAGTGVGAVAAGAAGGGLLGVAD